MKKGDRRAAIRFDCRGRSRGQPGSRGARQGRRYRHGSLRRRKHYATQRISEGAHDGAGTKEGNRSSGCDRERTGVKNPGSERPDPAEEPCPASD